MTCALHPHGAFGCDTCGNSRDWKDMSDAKSYTTTEAERLVAYHGAPAMKCPLDDDRFIATVRALDAAHAEVTALRARVAALESNSTNCVVGLEADGGFPCRACAPCARRERDEWKAKAEESAALAERLREALTALCEYERKRHPPRMGGDHFPPSLRDTMQQAHDALSTPAPAWLREKP